jgi:hypothetical protein
VLLAFFRGYSFPIICPHHSVKTGIPPAMLQNDDYKMMLQNDEERMMAEI